LYSLEWQIIVFPIIGRDVDRWWGSSLLWSSSRLSGLNRLGSDLGHPPGNQRIEIARYPVFVRPSTATAHERHVLIVTHIQAIKPRRPILYCVKTVVLDAVRIRRILHV